MNFFQLCNCTTKTLNWTFHKLYTWCLLGYLGKVATKHSGIQDGQPRYLPGNINISCHQKDIIDMIPQFQENQNLKCYFVHILLLVHMCGKCNMYIHLNTGSTRQFSSHNTFKTNVPTSLQFFFYLESIDIYKFKERRVINTVCLNLLCLIHKSNTQCFIVQFISDQGRQLYYVLTPNDS